MALLCILFIPLLGCSPIGYIGDSDGVEPEDFWTVPRRQMYDEGNDFIRADDLWVFVSNRGMVQKIDVRQVVIKLIKNPEGDKTDQNNIVSINNGFTTLTRSLVGIGRKIIIVSYQGMTAEYSIEVQDITGSNGGDVDDGKGFIVGDEAGFIRWK